MERERLVMRREGKEEKKEKRTSSVPYSEI